MKKKINDQITPGNIFADLGLPNPELALAKAELARQINTIIKKKKISQKDAAELLKIDQPKVSNLNKGKLTGFSLDRLFKFLNLLDQDVEIRVTKNSLHQATTKVVVPKSGAIKNRVQSNAISLQAKKSSSDKDY